MMVLGRSNLNVSFDYGSKNTQNEKTVSNSEV